MTNYTVLETGREKTNAVIAGPGFQDTDEGLIRNSTDFEVNRERRNAGVSAGVGIGVNIISTIIIFRS